MMKGLRLHLPLMCATLFVGGALHARTVILQHPRAIPTYPAEVQSYRDVKARIAVYPLPVVAELLTRALTNDGCRVVAALPQCGGKAEDRPDCILEPITLTSKTERNGEKVSLVTVLLVRVRKPVAAGEAVRGPTFQGASRISLGERRANDRGETMASQREIDDGIRNAVDNLLRIPALKAAVKETQK